jgi:hypothetical protein
MTRRLLAHLHSCSKAAVFVAFCATYEDHQRCHQHLVNAPGLYSMSKLCPSLPGPSSRMSVRATAIESHIGDILFKLARRSTGIIISDDATNNELNLRALTRH